MHGFTRTRNKWATRAALLGVVATLALGATPARAGLLLLDPEVPPVPDRLDRDPAPAPELPPVEPASLGQQPLPVQDHADDTPSESNSNQLNQLFQFETTPDKNAAGEWYASTGFSYLKFPGQTREYRYQVQGQYGITDQIAAGAILPVINADRGGSHTGVGDVVLYGQYKFDKLINPETVNVTGQLDVVLPTGSNTQLRDTGKFGVRPLLLAYKDFGQQGPGTLGVYGLFGFTLTTDSDLRLGLAATYEYHRLAAVLEFTDVTGNSLGRPLVTVTPGLIYRGWSPWELAVGAPIGLNQGSPDWAVQLKLTYAFQK